MSTTEIKPVKDIWCGFNLKLSEQHIITNLVLTQFKKPQKERLSKTNLIEVVKSIINN